MARARNIKPSLFKNELLGTMDPLITVLFISLWTLADKQGRLEDRPLRVRAETFPYRENIDINGYLTELERTGFIQRYSVSGQAIIQVVNFSKHQSPHNTEKDSVLPSFPEGDHGVKVITVIPPLDTADLTKAKRPDSLIPDSLIPDSLIPEKIHTHLSMLLNAGVENQIAKDWLSIRKIKRLPLTLTAFNAISKKITAAGLTMNAGIKICVEQGWAGFSADWLTTVPELKLSGPHVNWYDTEEATHERARREGVEIIDDLRLLRVRLNDVIQSKRK
jgi:hypothetical protein